MNEEHPFAVFVRTLGKGRNGSRSLTLEEAQQAMRMILAGQVEPEQLGAFLMLMRVKEESPEELAGFVMAAREALPLPDKAPAVRVDWSSYAGKRRQLPWFLLSALLLASHGLSVFMHGDGGRDDGRIYTPEALALLGITPAATLREAAEQLRAQHFSFMTLESLNPVLHRLMGMRPILGLRSPVNTVVRMLNPMRAPVMMQGIFNPGYRDLHQLAAQLAGQPHLAVLKGEGGEIERNPDANCLVKYVHDGVLSEEDWPALFGTRHVKDETMDMRRLPALWHGEIDDEYGVATVTGTAAIALRAAGMADSIEAAQTLAAELWQRRPARWLAAA